MNRARTERRLCAPWSAFPGDSSGGVIAPVAIMLPILLGAAGLAVDVGAWYASKRGAQVAADAAARGGALEMKKGGSTSDIVAAARYDAALNGFGDDADAVVTVSHPPESGGYAGHSSAVEVVVQRSPQQFFSQFIFPASFTVEARAVASLSADDTCIWALEPDEPGFTIVGTADVAVECGIRINSADPEALRQTGNSSVTASSIRITGGYSGGNLEPEPQTGVSPAPDPLAHLSPPSHAGCDFPNKFKVNGNGSETLSPGVYCGGIQINGGATVTLEPGTYILRGGSFTGNGSSTITGSGVTIYLDEDATIDLTATTLDLSAPTSGDFEGILFYHDRNAPPATVDKIAGNARLDLDGALYFPSTQLDMRGNSSAGFPNPTIVARALRFVGTSQLGGGGSDEDAEVLTVRLVE